MPIMLKKFYTKISRLGVLLESILKVTCLTSSRSERCIRLELIASEISLGASRLGKVLLILWADLNLCE